MVVSLALGCSGGAEPPTAPPLPVGSVPTASVPTRSVPTRSALAEPVLAVIPPAPRPAPATGEAVVATRALAAPTVDGVLDDDAWQAASVVTIDTDWRGDAFALLETHARIVWMPDALFLAFDGTYSGTIDAPEAPTDTDCTELYRHDALEAFIDPDPGSPETYLELELGPAGHFLDIAVDRSRRPRGDTAWSSGLTLASRLDAATHRFAIESRIPSAALGDRPLEPTVLRIGLYRIARVDDTRHYLARFPTGTERPSFHVPERFGRLVLSP